MDQDVPARKQNNNKRHYQAIATKLKEGSLPPNRPFKKRLFQDEITDDNRPTLPRPTNTMSGMVMERPPTLPSPTNQTNPDIMNSQPFMGPGPHHFEGLTGPQSPEVIQLGQEPVPGPSGLQQQQQQAQEQDNSNEPLIRRPASPRLIDHVKSINQLKKYRKLKRKYRQLASKTSPSSSSSEEDVQFLTDATITPDRPLLHHPTFTNLIKSVKETFQVTIFHFIGVKPAAVTIKEFSQQPPQDLNLIHVFKQYVTDPYFHLSPTFKASVLTNLHSEVCNKVSACTLMQDLGIPFKVLPPKSWCWSIPPQTDTGIRLTPIDFDRTPSVLDRRPRIYSTEHNELFCIYMHAIEFGINQAPLLLPVHVTDLLTDLANIIALNQVEPRTTNAVMNSFYKYRADVIATGRPYIRNTAAGQQLLFQQQQERMMRNLTEPMVLAVYQWLHKQNPTRAQHVLALAYSSVAAMPTKGIPPVAPAVAIKTELAPSNSTGQFTLQMPPQTPPRRKLTPQASAAIQSLTGENQQNQQASSSSTLLSVQLGQTNERNNTQWVMEQSRQRQQQQPQQQQQQQQIEQDPPIAMALPTIKFRHTADGRYTIVDRQISKRAKPLDPDEEFNKDLDSFLQQVRQHHPQ